MDVSMYRSIAGHYPYNLLILTMDYSKNFTTIMLLTRRHMAMFVVKSVFFFKLMANVIGLSIVQDQHEGLMQNYFKLLHKIR